MVKAKGVARVTRVVKKYEIHTGGRAILSSGVTIEILNGITYSAVADARGVYHVFAAEGVCRVGTEINTLLVPREWVTSEPILGFSVDRGSPLLLAPDVGRDGFGRKCPYICMDILVQLSS